MAPEPDGAWTWDEMIAEFRALGGVAENVRPGIGRHGRGLFVVDPARDAHVRAPANLLFDVDDVAIDHGRLRLQAGADQSARQKQFFERYQENFSFGAGAAEDGRRVLMELHQLPGAVQEHLLGLEPPGRRRFAPADDALLLKWFEDTRSAMLMAANAGPATTDKAQRYFVPVVELVNHSSRHGFFKPSEGGIEIKGRFADEVLYRYNMKDSWQKFTQWGFASVEPAAFSIVLEVSAPDGRHIRVGRNAHDFELVNGAPAPKIDKVGEVITLSHLMLGSRTSPGLPKWLFRRYASEWGINEAEELFDVIAHANRLWFLRLVELLEGHEGTMIARLRHAARLQLEALSFAIGARDDAQQDRPLVDGDGPPPA
jgi:hypothetical protein